MVLISSSSIIDNPWSVCFSRAAEVGEHLAEILLTRAHGRRPITLIGFSLGARVIYHCLLTMSRRSPTAIGIVEDVVLLGAPVSASPTQWRQICSVVGGRVINGYCCTDWLLRFLNLIYSSYFFLFPNFTPFKTKLLLILKNLNLPQFTINYHIFIKPLYYPIWARPFWIGWVYHCFNRKLNPRRVKNKTTRVWYYTIL